MYVQCRSAGGQINNNTALQQSHAGLIRIWCDMYLEREVCEVRQNLRRFANSVHIHPRGYMEASGGLFRDAELDIM